MLQYAFILLYYGQRMKNPFQKNKAQTAPKTKKTAKSPKDKGPSFLSKLQDQSKTPKIAKTKAGAQAVDKTRPILIALLVALALIVAYLVYSMFFASSETVVEPYPEYPHEVAVTESMPMDTETEEVADMSAPEPQAVESIAHPQGFDPSIETPEVLASLPPESQVAPLTEDDFLNLSNNRVMIEYNTTPPAP